MTGIFPKIDAWMAAQYPDYDQKLWGFCELAHRTVDKKTNPVPMTINGTSDRKYVTLDDRFELITWFRIPGTVQLSNEVEGQDWAFGFQEAPVNKASIRWVIAHKVGLGEDLIIDIAQSLPKQFTVAGSQISFIDKSTIVIDYDHETIYNTELGDTVYEKHRFPWNLYTITFSADVVLCSGATGCCDDSYLTETGACLVVENG